MPPYKKGRKRVIKRTVSTQTDDELLNFPTQLEQRQLQVRLERLKPAAIPSLNVEYNEMCLESTHNESGEEIRQEILHPPSACHPPPNQSNEIEYSSLVQPLVNRPAFLSRLPSTYSTFAKPITNNEKANSTLADITNREEDQKEFALNAADNNEKCDLENLLDKATIFCKPGPKSHKLKWLLRHQEDMRVPIALAQNEELSSRQNEDHLPTIEERSIEQTVVPATSNQEELINIEEVSLNLNIQCSGIPNDTEVLRSLIGHMNVDLPTEINQDALQANAGDAGYNAERNSGSDSQEPCNIQFNFAGFATTIAASRTAEDHNSHNSSGAKFDDQPDENSTKCIRITAETVHIHNHFYKS